MRRKRDPKQRNYELVSRIRKWEFRIKRLLKVISPILISILLAHPAKADWEMPESSEAGFHQIIVEDSVDFFKQFSYLTNRLSDSDFACPDMTSAICKTLKYAEFNYIFPTCTSESQVDCVESLIAKSETGTSLGAFERYSMPNHPALYVGDGKRLPANPQSPGIWKLEQAGHNGGNLYAVHVGFNGNIYDGKVATRNFYAQVYAFEEVPGRGEEFDQNNYSNFSWCDFDSETRKIRGCGGSAPINGEICVVQFQIGGTCGAQRKLPADTTLSLVLRISTQPNGWYHGRLDQPVIGLTKLRNGYRLQLTGEPVDVPLLHHSGLYQNMSAELKGYWDRCAKDDSCPKSTRFFGSDSRIQEGQDRNITSEQKPWTPKALETTRFFSKVNSGLTPKIDRVWAVRSLENTGAKSGACFSKPGFKGMVTTNATAYSDGPPALSRGVLRYSLAAPSRLEGAETDITGTYDLVMSRSFAKCVYGTRALSPRAEVIVTGYKADTRVATSVTSVNSQWVRVSAKEFSY